MNEAENQVLNQIGVSLDQISSSLMAMNNSLYSIYSQLNTISGYMAHMCNHIQDGPAAMIEQTRPSAVFKPELYNCGDHWAAILGSRRTGLVGIGDTPELAMKDFDDKWVGK